MIFLKKFVPALILLHTTILSASSPETCPIFISLGKDCEPASNIQNCNLRKNAYPLDWVNTPDFSDVCKLIECQFCDFLNPAFLKRDNGGITHTKYSIQFRHDFPSHVAGPHYTNSPEPGTDNTYQCYNGLIVENFLDYLNDVVEKYTRRINRLYSLLNSASTIIFLRTSIKPEEAKQFTQLMATNHPLVNYTLIVTHHNQNLNYNWNIPHVQSYYLERRNAPNASWGDPNEWRKMFIQLGFEQWMSRSKNNDDAQFYIDTFDQNINTLDQNINTLDQNINTLDQKK